MEPLPIDESDGDEPVPAKGPITNEEVAAVMAQLYQPRPHVTATELNFYAAAAFERKSLKTLMLLLEEGHLDVRLKPGGNIVLIDDYEWKIRDDGTRR